MSKMQRRESYLLGTTPPTLSTSMPTAIVKTVRMSQPQVAVGIDWSNPITRGMRLCLVPRLSLRDLASPSVQWIASGGSNPTSVVSNHGSGLHVVRDIYCDPPFRVDLKEQTQLVLMDWEGADQNDSGIFGTGNAIGACSFGVTRNATQINIVSQASSELVFKTPASLKGGAFLIKGSAVGFAVYDNGKVLQSGITVKPIEGLISTPRVVISSDMYKDGTYVSYTSNYLYIFWARELSNEEAISITANPYQIFAPLNKTVWVPA